MQAPRHARNRQTRQKRRILELVNAVDHHPTAEWLYTELKKEFPRLSLGTVYRNLAILSEQGRIRKILVEGAADRYEAEKAPHFHLICEKCGKVQDFTMPMHHDLSGMANKHTMFRIDHYRIDTTSIHRNKHLNI